MCSSLDALEKQLRNLPQGLDETYDRILLSIDEKNHDDVKRFLQWLAFSTCALKLVEIAEVVTVDFDSMNGMECIPGRRYRDPRDVLDKCSGLVTESEGVVNSRVYVVAITDGHDRSDQASSLFSQRVLGL
jgi:hypothetical protein